MTNTKTNPEADDDSSIDMKALSEKQTKAMEDLTLLVSQQSEMNGKILEYMESAKKLMQLQRFAIVFVLPILLVFFVLDYFGLV